MQASWCIGDTGWGSDPLWLPSAAQPSWYGHTTTVCLGSELRDQCAPEPRHSAVPVMASRPPQVHGLIHLFDGMSCPPAPHRHCANCGWLREAGDQALTLQSADSRREHC